MNKEFGEMKKDFKGARDGRDRTMCCFLLPLEVGVFFLGFLQIFYAVYTITNAIWWLDYSFSRRGNMVFVIFSLIMIVFIAPVWVGAWIYIRFFCWRNL